MSGHGLALCDVPAPGRSSALRVAGFFSCRIILAQFAAVDNGSECSY